MAGAAQSQAPPQPANGAAPVRVAEPDSAEEREADRISEAVMRGAAATPPAPPSGPPAIYRQCADCAAGGAPCAACAAEETELLMLKAAPAAGAVDGAGAARAATALGGAGRPLPEATRAYFEPRIGADLSGVRLHTDGATERAAQGIHARAYTLGQHIGFAPGSYAPAIPEGQRLLAHELTHAAFHASGPTRIHRRPEAAAPADPAPSSANDTTGSETGAPGTESPAPDVTMVHDRVDRILVSCEQRRIAFVTNSATYIYRLLTCNRRIPSATYVAEVMRNREENSIVFSLRPQAGGPEPEGGNDEAYDATFRWAVRRGQIDPVDLFEEQDSVLVDYGTEVPMPGGRRRRECLVTMDPRQVLSANEGRIDLLDRLPEKTVSAKWDIAEFGIGAIEIELEAGVEAFVDWHHGDGMLRDICLSSADGGGGYGGRATFDVEGGAKLQVVLTADLHASLEVGGIIDLVDVGGGLKLEGIAEVAGRINTLSEIAWDSSERNRGFRLGTNIQLAAASQLALHLSANAGLTVLGVELISTEWPKLVDLRRPFAWTGGLTFGDAFAPDVDLASVQPATAAQLQAAPQSGPISARRRRRGRGIPMRALIEAALGVGQGQLAIDGSSCEKALPLSWLKPGFLYEDQVVFDPLVNPGVAPTEVGRLEGPRLVSHDRVIPRRGAAITGPTPIGVTDENWPETGDWSRCFQYVQPATSSRTESATYRELLRGLGHDVSGVQVDHIRELQFGGEDSFANLWTLDRRANMSAGALHRAQIRAYRAIFGNLAGKYMRISSIGLDAKFDIPQALRSAPGAPEDDLL
ncbi:DUF4157 domain-containing protein [Alloyangia pacifica]|uniref:eCIS core domain-containing protein n=1 Tax=Alloyangia pacifica TaxID=311180 RepID=A0A1I6PSL7_9RHOB|nr:DUF4157 domain-containing protein [Alloyangia pacifica]SDG34227.1 protein of unknown function [Alloyangia pacifica]SFS43035.1 protein of unknown function [Alloyangia pacifica]